MRVIILISFCLVSLGLNAQGRRWFSPEHLIIQYAGSIGEVSGGAGYNVFKGKARVSAHFGYVPKAVGGPLSIVSTKLIFIPRSYRISERVMVNPFDAGLMITYHFGEAFNSTWPASQYPENYYWWKTTFRFHLNIESSITVKIRDNATFKAVTGYIEFNSNELYLVSLCQNMHSLRVWDAVMLGAGARFHF
jgi:hypothetical protein